MLIDADRPATARGADHDRDEHRQLCGPVQHGHGGQCRGHGSDERTALTDGPGEQPDQGEQRSRVQPDRGRQPRTDEQTARLRGDPGGDEDGRRAEVERGPPVLVEVALGEGRRRGEVELVDERQREQEPSAPRRGGEPPGQTGAVDEEPGVDHRHGEQHEQPVGAVAEQLHHRQLGGAGHEEDRAGPRRRRVAVQRGRGRADGDAERDDTDDHRHDRPCAGGEHRGDVGWGPVASDGGGGPASVLLGV